MHQSTNYFFIDITSNKVPVLCSKFYQTQNNYLFLAKIILTLINNATEVITNTHFLDWLLIVFVILSLSYLLVQILFDKTTYITNDIVILELLFFHILLSLLSLFIILAPQNDNISISFLILVGNGIIVTVFFEYCLYIISINKIKEPTNPLGNLIFLMNEKHKFPDKICLDIITKHKIMCQEKKCKFCHKITVYSKENKQFSLLSLSKILFKDLIQDKPIDDENISYYYLLDLYASSISKHKNLATLLIKYNKIKALLKLYSMNGTGTSKITISENFKNNLNLVFQFIMDKISIGEENKNNSTLIQIDLMSQVIQKFIKKIKYLIKICDQTPLDYIFLAKQFTNLKKNIDINFLHSKDNKINYSCILYGFILEEIYNDSVSNTINITEHITSMDDILESRYNGDSFLLAAYDVLNSKIVIKQCGKELFDFNYQNIQSLFPSYLQKQGIALLMNKLRKTKDNMINYYFRNPIKDTVESIIMKYSILPLVDQSNQIVYIIMNYKIRKDSFLIFNTEQINSKSRNCLIGLSEKCTTLLKITPQMIQSSFENHTYLRKDDVLITDSKTINFKAIQNFHSLNNKESGDSSPLQQRQLTLIFKEKIDNIEIFKLKELVSSKKKTNSLNENVIEKRESELSETPEDIEIPFNKTVQTNITSSTFTNTSNSSYKRSIEMQNNNKEITYKNFFLYTYYLFSYNVLIIIVIIIFFVIEIINNNVLEKHFNIITNFYDFQNLFYLTSLSIFSLTCNSDFVEQIDCVNQFSIYSKTFSQEHNLTDKELMNVYVSRELSIKSDLIISTLQSWERDNGQLNSKQVRKKLNENFEFTGLEEVNTEIKTITINLNFEDAIKRFVNTVNLLTSMNEFLTSPVFIISIDENGGANLENIKKNKTPINGSFMNEAQRYYYTLLLNYQKYLLRLISIGDLLYEYYNQKVSSTSNQVLIFIILFITLHFIMGLFSSVFVMKFKSIHLNYYISSVEKLTDPQFISFYNEKLTHLDSLTYLYKENPNTLVKKILRQNQKELIRKAKKAQSTPKDEVIKVDTQTNSKLNLPLMNNIYNYKVVFVFYIKILLLFSTYLIICIIMYIILNQKISNLSLMNDYTKNNFDTTNSISINMGLVQLMSLSNQTDNMLYQYFSTDANASLNKDKGYVVENLQKTFSYISELNQMHKEITFFNAINKIIDVNCDTMYDTINDPYIDAMMEQFPESDYQKLLSTYCKTFPSLDTYKDNLMSIELVTYQVNKLLNLFVDRKYSTYAKINNSNLLYSIYTEYLLLIRPLRKRIYTYILDEVITLIISQYNMMMIVFIVFNFVYEAIIFLCIKFSVIDRLILYTKEIVVLAKALDS